MREGVGRSGLFRRVSGRIRAAAEVEEFECLEERFVEVDACVGFGVEAFEACEEEADEFETGEGFAGEGVEVVEALRVGVVDALLAGAADFEGDGLDLVWGELIEADEGVEKVADGGGVFLAKEVGVGDAVGALSEGGGGLGDGVRIPCVP